MRTEKTLVQHGLYELADLALVGGVFVGLFTLVNSGSMSNGVESFMKARITVPNAILGIGFLLFWRFIFQVFGVYHATSLPFREEMRRTISASAVAGMYFLIFPLTSRAHAFTWMLAIYCWFLEIGAAVAFRVGHRMLKKCIYKGAREIIIVGSGPRALSLYRKIQADKDSGYQVTGFVDSPNGHHVSEEIQSKMLGPLRGLDQILMRRVVDHVLIALPMKSCYDEIQQAIAVCEQCGVESEYLSDTFQFSLARPQVSHLNNNPVVRLKVVEDGDRVAVKRVLDVTGALLGIILFAPVMLVIAVAIKTTSKGPILFVQMRYGLNKRRFPMLKFRTMVENAEQLQASLESLNEVEGPVFKMNNDPRVTPIGDFLRKTSLDELPQLINVLAGHMSLVGPRPLPNRDVSRFDVPHLMRRFSVKPGLTGLWQVSGRSNTGFSRWIELDLQYIDSWSLGLDFKILAQTLPAVIKRTGAK